MVLIVGLGNPGEKYMRTRHNLGFMVLDAFLQKLAPVEKTVWRENKKLKSQIAQIVTDNAEIILAKPQTMMNASGHAVKKLADFYLRGSKNNIAIKQYNNLFVLHDDVDLPLGRIKIVKDKGSAGHWGVMSIIEQLGTVDFVRFRLGIGHPHAGRRMEGGKRISKFDTPKEVEDFVLAPFSPTERDEVRRLVKKTIEAIEIALDEGIEKAMNRFN